MNQKKAFYVIPEMAELPVSEWIPIAPQDIDSFKRDFEGRKNQLTVATGFNLAKMEKDEKEELKKEVSRFFGLPENGEIKPVFYIELDGKLYFGFTPRLRLFYEKEIYDGLSKEQRDNSLDYCKSMFGFATDNESYRSRLSFQEAVIDKNISENGKTAVVLGEPKPTSYLDYLVGKNGEAVTYRGDFALRGMKQYWLHTKEAASGLGNNKDVGSDFYPYPKETSFTGQIRFSNLSEEELGMLLWSLLLEKNSQQNIGKGKTYGFGRVEISLKQLNILDTAAMYDSETLCLEPYREEKELCSEYVDKAKKDMTRFLGKDVMEHPPVRDFLLMKNGNEIPDDSKTHYMSIEGRDSDYQVRNREQIPLDTIGVVMGKEKRKTQAQTGQGSHGNGYNSGKWRKNNSYGNKNSGSREYKDSGNATTSMASVFAGIKIDS